MTIATSASAQADDALAATFTPNGVSLSALSALRFQTVTAKLACASRRAMWEPMMPVPSNAMRRSEAVRILYPT